MARQGKSDAQRQNVTQIAALPLASRILEDAEPEADIDEKKLTEPQRKYLEAIVNGNNQTDAARLAGYKFPEQQGYYLARQPKMRALIRQALLNRLESDGAAIAVNTLIKIAQNEKAPAGARVMASNSLLDRAGIASKVLEKQREGGQKALSDMTVDELDAFIQAGQAAISKARDAAAIEGTAVPVDNPDTAQNSAQQG